MDKGQASVESMLILAAVLLIASSLHFMGRDSNQTTNAVAAARGGVQSAITDLAVQYGEDINIVDWTMDGDNIIFNLSVQGDPPPNLRTIVENAALDQLERSVGGGYEVTVKIERTVK